MDLVTGIPDLFLIEFFFKFVGNHDGYKISDIFKNGLIQLSIFELHALE